jgi:hypothetical protein
MKRLFRILVPLCLLTCGPDGGVSVDLMFVMRPSEQCVYSADSNTIDLDGIFDPALAPAMHLGIAMRNNLATSTDNGTECPGSGEGCDVLSNDAVLSAWEVCWFRQDDEGPLATCDDVPSGQQAVLPGSGSVAAGARGVGSVEILDTAALQTIYGAAFAPSAIPVQGAFAEDTNRSGTIDPEDTVFYSYGPESAASPTRSAAWGTFPAENYDIVVVRFRAQFVTPKGDELVSNWMSFPVRVCPRCFAGACGALVQTQCFDRCNNAPCPSDDPATTGTVETIGPLCRVQTPGACSSHCPATTAGGPVNIDCYPYDFIGPQITLGACLPAQGYSPYICTEVSFCDP